MAARETTEGTGAPEGHTGLPQMDVGTFPSQIFWLVVTFGLLFLVLSRKTLPMIEAIIGNRRIRIEGDLGTAEAFRKEAQNALAAYEAALAQARAKAHRLADENRKVIVAARSPGRMIFLMRLGILPFFWIACLFLYWWACRSFGKVVAVMAIGLHTDRSGSGACRSCHDRYGAQCGHDRGKDQHTPPRTERNRYA